MNSNNTISKSSPENFNDAIAELISKKRKRILAEKQVKIEPTNLDDGHDLIKKLKFDLIQEEIPNTSTEIDKHQQQQKCDIISNPSSSVSPINESTCSSDNITDESTSQFEYLDQFINCLNSSKQLQIKNNEFANVTGRLSITNVCKYRVTVNELERRVNGPESFSFSLLGGLLRRAKMPNNTIMLKNELESTGINVPKGRRRGHLTLFSSLLEEEASVLARDFSTLIENNFPTDCIAAKVLKDKMTNGEYINIKELLTMKKMIQEFKFILEKDSSTISDNIKPELLEKGVQEPLSIFSMLTHGFGNPAIQAVIKMFESFIDAQISVMKV